MIFLTTCKRLKLGAREFDKAQSDRDDATTTFRRPPPFTNQLALL